MPATLKVTPETLVSITSAALSLVFTYFPGLNVKYAALSADVKSIINLVALAIIDIGIYLISCGAHWINTDLQCAAPGDIMAIAGQLVGLYVIALVSSQGMYLATRKLAPQSVKDAQNVVP